jgi:predicted TIM-barrel enzyme
MSRRTCLEEEVPDAPRRLLRPARALVVRSSEEYQADCQSRENAEAMSESESTWRSCGRVEDEVLELKIAHLEISRLLRRDRVAQLLLQAVERLRADGVVLSGEVNADAPVDEADLDVCPAEVRTLERLLERHRCVA